MSLGEDRVVHHSKISCQLSAFQAPGASSPAMTLRRACPLLPKSDAYSRRIGRVVKGHERLFAPQKNSKPFRRLPTNHPTAQTLSVLGGRNNCHSLFRPPARSVGRRPNGRRGTRLCRRMGRELAHSGR